MKIMNNCIKSKYHRLLLWGIICAAGLFAILLPILTLGKKSTYAVSVDECIRASGAYNENGQGTVDSINNACNKCVTNGGNSKAAMWISSEGMNDDRIVYRTTINSISEFQNSDKTIIGTLWGRSYSCNHTGSRRPIYGYYVWFGAKGNDSNKNEAYDFIKMRASDLENGALFRGWDSGKAFSWTTNPSGATVEFKAKDFFDHGAKCEYEADLGSSGGAKKAVCKLTISVNRCFSPQSGGYKKNGQCYGDDSVIKLVLNVKEKEEEEKLEAIGNVFGFSSVMIPEQGDDINRHEWETSSSSGTVTMKISTRQESIDVFFQHKLFGNFGTTSGGPSDACSVYTLDSNNKPVFTKKCKMELPKKYDYKDNGDGTTTRSVTAEYQSFVDSACFDWNIYQGITTETFSDAAYEKFSDPAETNKETGEPGPAIYGKVHRKRCPWKAELEAEKMSDNIQADEKKLNDMRNEGGEGTNAFRELSAQIKAQKNARDEYIRENGISGLYNAGDEKPVATEGGNTLEEMDIDYSGLTHMEKVTVNLEPGTRTHICQKQTFDPAYFAFVGNQTDSKISGRLEEVTFVISGISGVGTIKIPDSNGVEHDVRPNDWSKACVVVYRPLEPPIVTDGIYQGYEGATTNRDNDTPIVYAGENSTVSWAAQGWNWNTHRIGRIQAITYLVPVTIPYRDDIADGSIYYKTGKSTKDICSYWNEKFADAPPGSCNMVSDIETIDHSQPDKDNRDMHEWYDREPKAKFEGVMGYAVPDDIGAKYCNSIGYKFEYWFAVNKKNDEEKGDVDIMQDEWVHESEFDYWAVLDADCRTIAKKPTSAVWNTGMSTPGGIKTSLAQRAADPVLSMTVPVDTSKKLYGSWAEYITAANRQIFGMGSGASLWKSDGGGSGYTGLCNSTNMLEGNTPLTLANGSLTESLGSTKLKPCETLGKAGISEDSNFLGRVYTYLDSNRLNAIGSKNNIKILQGGEITEDVIAGVNPPYASGSGIYGIPQTIILATGSELKISENVTKIDAWIIAPNATINTCSEFKKKETQAEVLTPTLGIGKGYVPYTDNAGDVHCNKQLVFNGPVIAGGLELNRQYGADAHMMIGEEEDADGRNRPAEVFNLRADAYIWAYAQAQRYGSSFTESYSRELAPRY